jgi:uncharacterized protein (TIGR02466 family)
MKKTSIQARQPTQAEIQTLLKFFQAGQLPEAEVLAKSLLKSFPHVPIINNVLGSVLAGQGKFAEAVDSFKKLVTIDPKSAELHFNLALMQSNSGQLEDAATNYRKASQLMPKFVDAHYNLGTTLQALGQNADAAASYRKAIEIQPGFFEAHGNLGAVLQAQGKLNEAIESYRKAIAINPDARGFFNLGTALRNQGLLEDAIHSFQKAIAADPHYAEAHSNLGESQWHHGQLNEAVESFNKALAIDPDNISANYNLAVFLYDNGELQRAISHFERSQFGDWQERVLYCLYKTEQYETFKQKLGNSIRDNPTSPFLATLSAHYAVNFGVEDEYNFCKNPLDLVYHGNIQALSEPNSALLAELLSDINSAEISQRKQSRLHHGTQSSGNLFKRPEASFRKLAELVADTIRNYQQQYANEDCMFIKAFPDEIEFSSSWYVKMQSGGHLTSHIHEEGWISGAVYLAMPKNKVNKDDGSIELSTHGDGYPQKHGNFPTKTVAPNVGDVVFFPSSVFHRTIPFSSNEERICIAFDLKPQDLKAQTA